MAEESIRALYQSAENQREKLGTLWGTNDELQDNLAIAISSYEECLKLANSIPLFSSNETLDDITTGDLPYLLINNRLAELINRMPHEDRKSVIKQAKNTYERYLLLLYQCEMLSPEHKKLYELYVQDPDTFSTISTNDPNLRRDAKIAGFKFEKDLKKKLEAYEEDSARELYLTEISLCTHNTFQALESLNLELKVLAMAPPITPNAIDSLDRDYRERMGLRHNSGDYSEKLDLDLVSTASSAPILSSSGKPLRPFTLLSNRKTLRKDVFKPGHNLPTMTIDEYLEEERARGGIIEGGGEASGIRPEPDEDNFEKADEETMKAREWDEFTEENHRGSGNTLNKG
ncbi:TOR signaling pathway regulator (TapA) [Blumeria hordei DH14]|uniref:TOR signaling pathway regulator (TapA) n=1 Tax=Blumeria graminis f. sp. hordei (strain DH14) TaxID=546991 RepID=N1JQY4_BLUG1|nr:TOR signaling pathway regulator (TapA) [Blumeria hordei DH14]